MSTPYIITQITGITYAGLRIPLPIQINGIHSKPLRKLEEALYQAVRNARTHDPYVKLHIKTKSI